MPLIPFAGLQSDRQWAKKGVLVRILGGPLWEITRISTAEVHLRSLADQSDIPAEVCWGADNFFSCWEEYHPTRFERSVEEDE